MSTIVRDRYHKARIRHTCEDCRRTIWPGETYRRMYGKAYWADDMHELKLCGNCTDIKDNAHTVYIFRD